MATNEIHVEAPLETVWDVLADPRLYTIWVVGASAVRDVEGRWPEPGSRFHHSQAGGLVRDTTVALEAEPPRRLLLEARTRPLLVAHVELLLEREGPGTHVTQHEWPIGGVLKLPPDVVPDALIHARNAIGVQRLKRLAEITHAQRGQPS